MTELSINAFEQAKKKIENLPYNDAMELVVDLSKHNKIDNIQFRKLADIIKTHANIDEDIITEMSIRDVKSRIREILDLEEVQKYKMDNFTYEKIPFDVFEANGVALTHLKQYKQSSDIITFDLGIDINPIKRNVDVFLQKSGIFS